MCAGTHWPAFKLLCWAQVLTYYPVCHLGSPHHKQLLLKSPLAAKPKKFPQFIGANPCVAQRPDLQAGTLPALGLLGLPGLMLYLPGTDGDVPRMAGRWAEPRPADQ